MPQLGADLPLAMGLSATHCADGDVSPSGHLSYHRAEEGLHQAAAGRAGLGWGRSAPGLT